MNRGAGISVPSLRMTGWMPRRSALIVPGTMRDQFRSIVYGYMSRVRRADAKLQFPERTVLSQAVPGICLGPREREPFGHGLQPRPMLGSSQNDLVFSSMLYNRAALRSPVTSAEG